MKSHTISLINAIVLILLGAWGYWGSETPSPTALIPVGAGIILLFLNKGVRAENKIIGHFAVILTFLILLGLIKPLLGALERADDLALLRVGIMILSTVLALGVFIKSFLDARKTKSG